MDARGQPPSPASVEPPAGQRCVGEAVYLYAFDVAYGIRAGPLENLLGQPVEQYGLSASKRSPREMFFYRPRMVRLPPVQRVGPRGPVSVRRAVKLFPVGAVSISIRVPFQVPRVEDLVGYHDLSLDGRPLHDEAKDLARRAVDELGPMCVGPLSPLRDEEAYTVFCLQSPMTGADGQTVSAEDWLAQRRRAVASALTQEPDPANLSDQEAEESTGSYLSYYDRDLTVVDWDAALLVDDPANWDEALHVMELANVQLAELEAYDRILDEAMERSYRDLGRRPVRRTRKVLSDLREIRVDLARLTDELSNSTKFFGDWHLARIYQQLSSRLHLSDWRRVIDEKLRTLDGLYQIFKQDQLNRWMLILEATIVLLFVIDLIIIISGIGR